MHRLRPFQEDAVRLLRLPMHLICVSPTGSGKSLIYEKTARDVASRTVLVSPLIALARQQAARLRDQGFRVRLGAGPDADPPPDRGSGIWVVSPEKLLHSQAANDALKKWKPDFLAVDECHCLWDWGEDFRPAFRAVPGWVGELEIPRSLWLTATLPPNGEQLILGSLPEPRTRKGTFSLPPALSLDLRRVPLGLRPSRVIAAIRNLAGKGIIFVPTRKLTARVARLLSEAGIRTLIYHAGMSSEERKGVERRLAEPGIHAVIATSAFGMGMDYSFLRWVILWQAPPSILALAQSVGRVGRAGRPGKALVFWDDDDFRLLEWTVRGSSRRRESLLAIYRYLHSDGCRESSMRSYFETGHPRAPGYADLVCGRCDWCHRHGYN